MKKEAKKLVLKRETLRTLREEVLTEVVGGQINQSVDTQCYKTGNPCNPQDTGASGTCP